MTNSSIPRPEYPRPQLVREKWMNLNGPWSFEIDNGNSGSDREFHKGGQLKQTITVPFCPESELSGINNKDFMLAVWYEKKITIPADWKGQRVKLHIGACDYDTTVWVNAKHAGFHRGGYTPFSFDITPHLADGENTITIKAYDNTRDPLQPKGKQSHLFQSHGCHYTRTTGIWQTVWLEPLPETNIRQFKVYPQIAQKRLAVNAELDGPLSNTRLVARALAGGKEVGKVEVPATRVTPFSIDLAELTLWEPGKPFLYDLELQLVRDDQPVDQIKSYFGMREISIEGKKVLINGKSVFQRLVLDQGFYPDGIYTAPSDEALKKDIELSLAVGFNGARLHEKVFEPRFLYWADQLGYLCWGEYPNWGLDHAHPQALERVLPEWMESIHRDFNSPAIVGWCPFNETPNNQNSELIRTVYRATKAVDPTRPTIDTSGYVHVETDIYDCHNYEQDPAKFAATYEEFKTTENAWRNHPKFDAPYQGQPYFVSEYGGIWWNPGDKGSASWGYGERPKGEQEVLDRYKGLTEALLFHPKMFAFCYTQLYDVEQETNGLYTYDRKPKFDPEVIRKINVQPAAIEK